MESLIAPFRALVPAWLGALPSVVFYPLVFVGAIAAIIGVNVAQQLVSLIIPSAVCVTEWCTVVAPRQKPAASRLSLHSMVWLGGVVWHGPVQVLGRLPRKGSCNLVGGSEGH